MTKQTYFCRDNRWSQSAFANIWGNILNIASNAACMDIVGSYGASKQAIIKWTRAFGKKYGHDGIL